MFELFDIFAAAILAVCLYLAYTVYHLRQDLEEIGEQAFITRTILFKFIEKIADEKIEAGEWTEDETI
jgi:hypothetical protein